MEYSTYWRTIKTNLIGSFLWERKSGDCDLPLEYSGDITWFYWNPIYLIGNLTSLEIVHSLTRIAFRSNHYWIKPPFNLNAFSFNILNVVIVCLSLFKTFFCAAEESILDGYLNLSKTDFYPVALPYIPEQ